MAKPHSLVGGTQGPLVQALRGHSLVEETQGPVPGLTVKVSLQMPMAIPQTHFQDPAWTKLGPHSQGSQPAGGDMGRPIRGKGGKAWS